MQYEVSLKEAETQVVLKRHVDVEQVDLGSTIGTSFQEEYGFLGSKGIEAAGPPFLIYHHGPKGSRWEVDICAPAAHPAPNPPAGYTFDTVVGGLVATSLHRGPYETIGAAYDAVAVWIKEHGLVGSGPVREIYLSEPGTVPDEIETILEWPVHRVPVPAA
jgi:effector-binding domain-containing protein